MPTSIMDCGALAIDKGSLPSIAVEHWLCSHHWVLVANPWSDEASTELLTAGEAWEYDDERPAYPSLRLMKLLFVVVTVVAVAASVAVVMHISDQSVASAPTLDAHPGDCLTWPAGAAERAMQVNCADEHLFEVADSTPIDVSTDPGNPGADARFQQTCAQAVAGYLGPRYDPGGRFVVGMMWTPPGRNQQPDGRLMCGLQLPSDGVASATFRGRVVDQDQSRVWPTGTCLGIRGGQTTEVAVQCALPHALEITGTIDLSTVFGDAAPSTAAQDAVVRDACGAATSAYLAPVALEATSLTLRYQPIEAAGWGAGSRRIACRIGSANPDGSWATLVGNAKSGVLIDGQPAVTQPSPAQPPPTDDATASVIDSSQSVASAPVEEPVASAPVEVPVRVNPQSDGSTLLTGAAPHLVAPEAPGPPAGPPPGPPPESPLAQALPESVPAPPG